MIREAPRWRNTNLFLNLDPSTAFRYKGVGEKEVLEHFTHVIKICPNKRLVFKNKLQNTWAAILKTSSLSMLNIFTFSM